MIKAVLFDLDGTLINTNELIYKSFSYVLRDILKLDADDDEITSTYGKPLENTMSKYKNDEYNSEELVNIYIYIYIYIMKNIMIKCVSLLMVLKKC